MIEYLIVETRSPLISNRNLTGLELALALAGEGVRVTLWIMQDAVQLLQLKFSEQIDRCVEEALVTCYVDEFSLAQRGCVLDASSPLKTGDMALFSEHLMRMNSRAIWH